MQQKNKNETTLSFLDCNFFFVDSLTLQSQENYLGEGPYSN